MGDSLSHLDNLLLSTKNPAIIIYAIAGCAVLQKAEFSSSWKSVPSKTWKIKQRFWVKI